MNVLLSGVLFIPLLYWMIPPGVWQIMPRMGHEVALKFILLLSLGSVVDNKWAKSLAFISAGWLMLVTLMYISNPPQFYLITKAVQEQTSYVLLGMLITALVYTWPGRVRVEHFMNWVCAGALVQSVVTLPNLLGFYPFDLAVSSVTGGKWTQSLPGQLVGAGLECQNYLASYLALSVPFFFRSKKWAWGLVLVVPVLIMCRTTSAVAAALAAVCVLRPGLLALYAAAGIAYVSFDWTKGSLYDRIDLWGEAISQMNHPLSWLVGQGPGTQTASMQRHLHNEFINILHDYGLVGLTAATGFLISLSTRNRLLVASGVAFCVHSLLNHPLHIPVTAFIFCILVGLAMRKEGSNDCIQV